MNTLTRVLNKLTKRDDGCWEWLGAISSGGYGSLVVKGKSLKPHRFIYSIMHGAIPEGMQVCHHCDNPPCCNPDHLFLGSHQDNMRDMHDKGRAAKHNGENNARAILTNAGAKRIKTLLAEGKTPLEISVEYNVVQSTIGHIQAGRTWKDA